MTTNVHVRVPDHVAAVVVQLETYTLNGWKPAETVVVRGGTNHEFTIYDTRRIACIVERDETQLRDDGVPVLNERHPTLTINEHAHGDDHHEAARTHG